MRFHNIQLLRGVAAVAVVVLNHLGYYADRMFGVADWPVPRWFVEQHAVFPVPLFFAVSGFVLTHALRSAPPGRFLAARALRLYPGYWLAVGLTLGVIWLTPVWPAAYRQCVTPANVGFSLLPRRPGTFVFPLGVEWSLVSEVLLSAALAGLGLFGLRRGLPAAAAVWVAVILGNLLVWPGYRSDPIPTWRGFPLSGYNVPFLLGVLAYYLKDRGRLGRWAVLAGLGLYAATVPHRAPDLEWCWVAWGPAAAAAVWLAVQLPQLPAGGWVVRFGDCTYGLYLLHVPVLMTTFYLMSRQGWLTGSVAGVAVAGVAALVLGTLFGAIECRLHARLRPLAKVDVGGRVRRLVSGRIGRLRGRVAG